MIHAAGPGVRWTETWKTGMYPERLRTTCLSPQIALHNESNKRDVSMEYSKQVIQRTWDPSQCMMRVEIKKIKMT